MDNHTIKTLKGISLAVMAATISLLSFFFCNDLIQKELAIDTIRAGVIVDKRTTVSGGLFTSSSVLYWIEVSAEIEYNDELLTETKSFAVNEDVYNQYFVGDWFDIQSPTKNENVNKADG